MQIYAESVTAIWDVSLTETQEDIQRCTWTVDDLATGEETWKDQTGGLQIKNNNKTLKKK